MWLWLWLWLWLHLCQFAGILASFGTVLSCNILTDDAGNKRVRSSCVWSVQLFLVFGCLMVTVDVVSVWCPQDVAVVEYATKDMAVFAKKGLPVVPVGAKKLGVEMENESSVLHGPPTTVVKLLGVAIASEVRCPRV